MPHLGALIATAESWLRRANTDKGATMVEYGLIVAFIAMVVIVALLALGPLVHNLYTGVLPSL